MKFVSVRELRGNSAEIWRRVNREHELVITSNGRPIAVLSKVSEEDLEESLAAIRRARAMQAVTAIQLSSMRAGRHRMSAESVEAEIKAVRRARPR